MKLNIKNFAKIKEADIAVDGITVIAGENNTGKSTVGKVLFSLFNALSDIDSKIREERLKEIESTNRGIMLNYASTIDMSRSVVNRVVYSVARKIGARLREQLNSSLEVPEDSISEIIREVMMNCEMATKSSDKHDWEEMLDEVNKNTREVLNLPEEIIIMEFISRYFKSVFHSQIQALSDGEDKEAIVTLEIKDKKERLTFEKNYCKNFEGEINIIHKAIYIDNPFIVDELSEYNDLTPMNQMLKDLLFSSYKERPLDGVIESVRAKEKLSNIFETLRNVVDGKIIIDQNDEFYLKSDNYNEPISFRNLSTGIKSFVILKMLLEKGCLKNKDVVILDEPEIHLHPQWQIAYAELIVLLQKQFDLSVIVTTHSPYFVDAINLFSCKYDTDKKVNYYLSSSNGNAVSMEDVTDRIDMIYQKMTSPIQMLDTLRYELNNN